MIQKPRSKKGPLGLQLHGDRDMSISFRKIEIIEQTIKRPFSSYRNQLKGNRSPALRGIPLQKRPWKLIPEAFL
jgi:hypothetical protein